MFDRAWQIVRDEYFDPKIRGVDWDAMPAKYRARAEQATSAAALYQTISEMLNEVRDQHLFVRTPNRVREMKAQTRQGLGLSFRILDHQPVIVDVAADSELFAKGVRPGWIWTAVDGRAIPADLPLSQWDRQLRLDEKCQARQLMRLEFIDAEDHPQQIEAACKVLSERPVTEVRKLGGGVSYFRFDAFGIPEGNWFAAELPKQGLRSPVVVDLRQNPGGRQSVVMRLLGLFFAKDQTIGTSFTRKGGGREWRVKGTDAKAHRGKVAVLIDAGSASASEIFAAAMQESGRGRVFGRKSAGGVLVSVRRPLPDGGELSVSVYDYVTAKGRRLEGQGVTPDEAVDPSLPDLRQNRDTVLEEALDWIRSN
ncbi:MAG: hypothetical protein K2Q23_02005 [Bryobacteraceae bacterium]|nr:hypothetical protein [Bryobacteraceae bacterium]